MRRFTTIFLAVLFFVVAAAMIVKSKQRWEDNAEELMRTAGSDTVHLIVRAIDVPVVGLVIDRFDTGDGISASTNDPYLEGGRSAVIDMP